MPSAKDVESSGKLSYEALEKELIELQEKYINTIFLNERIVEENKRIKDAIRDLHSMFEEI